MCFLLFIVVVVKGVIYFGCLFFILYALYAHNIDKKKKIEMKRKYITIVTKWKYNKNLNVKIWEE